MADTLKNRYVCDFETTTTSPTKVWAWGVASVANPDEWHWGESIEEFFEYVQTLKNPKLYFHNLKFDGNFIFYHLLKNGFQWVDEEKDLTSRTLTSIIDDSGQFYKTTICFSLTTVNRKNRAPEKRRKKVTIYDSMKLLNMSVAKMAKTFGLDIMKGNIDYDRHNEPCEVTQEEIDYLENDVKIVAKALKQMFETGLTKSTISSCALFDYKTWLRVDNPMKKDPFSCLFPALPDEIDCCIRLSYKGGFTFANPEYAGKYVGYGSVYDNNSLYPSIMKNKLLPYGSPKHYKGGYVEDSDYPLYVQRIRVDFELKEGYLPTIQLKKDKRFSSTEYLTSSNGQTVDIWLTSVDLQLFKDHYNFNYYDEIEGYMFHGSKNLFKGWLEKWGNIKIQAEKDGNVGLRQLAKLIMNSSYGKFGLNPVCRSKKPVYDEENDKIVYKPVTYVVKDEDGNPVLSTITGNCVETDLGYRESIYVPIATFITSYGRDITIRASQKIHEESKRRLGYSIYLYSDTDSLHILGFEEPEGLDIDPYRLGAWKCESHFRRAKFLQAKRYIEDEFKTIKIPEFNPDEETEEEFGHRWDKYVQDLDNFDQYGPFEGYETEIGPHMDFLRSIYGERFKTGLKVTCAGLPEKCHNLVTWENFKEGTEYGGKLQPVVVSGGVIMLETKFKLNRKGLTFMF